MAEKCCFYFLKYIKKKKCCNFNTKMLRTFWLSDHACGQVKKKRKRKSILIVIQLQFVEHRCQIKSVTK